VLAAGPPLSAQEVPAGPAELPSSEARVAQASGSSLVLVRGTSEVVDHGATLERVSIADPGIADAVVVSANEVVVNAKAPGHTTLLLWDEGGGRRTFSVHVTADAASLQEQLDRILPGAGIEVAASGNTLILTGTVRDPGVETRALSLARSLAAEETRVVNQMTVPDRGQVMLKVRFAEVNRSALHELGLEAVFADEENAAGALGTGQVFTPPSGQTTGTDEALLETSQDAVNFFLFHRPSNVQVFLRALETRGLLKSLAEPNLMAVPGDTASFLAGGEFPFPVLQGGTSNAVTIQFKEFGIRLNFVPHITNSGAVRLHVAPEVSQLDFANGLDVSGFRIPALLSRRAQTVIELAPGQTFAIAGLVDNSLMKTVNKVPILGDIPILGALFRSEDVRQNRSELLVLVTPHVVRPTDEPPPLPTGEPDTWDWVDELKGSAVPDAADAVEPIPPMDQDDEGGENR
jgi:pilus assembly protein CpaC